MSSCEFCKFFKNTFFDTTHPVAASETNPNFSFTVLTVSRQFSCITGQSSDIMSTSTGKIKTSKNLYLSPNIYSNTFFLYPSPPR